MKKFRCRWAYWIILLLAGVVLNGCGSGRTTLGDTLSDEQKDNYCSMFTGGVIFNNFNVFDLIIISGAEVSAKNVSIKSIELIVEEPIEYQLDSNWETLSGNWYQVIFSPEEFITYIVKLRFIGAQQRLDINLTQTSSNFGDEYTRHVTGYLILDSDNNYPVSCDLTIVYDDLTTANYDYSLRVVLSDMELMTLTGNTSLLTNVLVGNINIFLNGMQVVRIIDCEVDDLASTTPHLVFGVGSWSDLDCNGSHENVSGMTIDLYSEGL